MGFMVTYYIAIKKKKLARRKSVELYFYFVKSGFATTKCIHSRDLSEMSREEYSRTSCDIFLSYLFTYFIC